MCQFNYFCVRVYAYKSSFIFIYAHNIGKTNISMLLNKYFSKIFAKNVILASSPIKYNYCEISSPTFKSIASYFTVLCAFKMHIFLCIGIFRKKSDYFNRDNSNPSCNYFTW